MRENMKNRDELIDQLLCAQKSAAEEFSNYIGDTKYYVELILSPILFVIGFILIFLLIIKSENREENK